MISLLLLASNCNLGLFHSTHVCMCLWVYNRTKNHIRHDGRGAKHDEKVEFSNYTHSMSRVATREMAGWHGWRHRRVIRCQSCIHITHVLLGWEIFTLYVPGSVMSIKIIVDGDSIALSLKPNCLKFLVRYRRKSFIQIEYMNFRWTYV